MILTTYVKNFLRNDLLASYDDDDDGNNSYRNAEKQHKQTMNICIRLYFDNMCTLWIIRNYFLSYM